MSKVALYDADKDEFTRGEYEGWSLGAVAEENPSYILFLLDSETDADTKEELRIYIEDNPDYFEDEEL